MLPVNDPVSHPSHYCRGRAEVIDLIEGLPFCRGAAIKYIYRAGFKDPTKELEDLKKAAWNIQREIERYCREHPEQVEEPKVPANSVGSNLGFLARAKRRKD